MKCPTFVYIIQEKIWALSHSVVVKCLLLVIVAVLAFALLCNGIALLFSLLAVTVLALILGFLLLPRTKMRRLTALLQFALREFGELCKNLNTFIQENAQTASKQENCPQNVTSTVEETPLDNAKKTE